MTTETTTEMREYCGLEVMLARRECYVVHVDRTEGITIHYLDDDTEAFCINRKEVVNTEIRAFSYGVLSRAYHEMFDDLLEMIKKGVIDHDLIVYKRRSIEYRYKPWKRQRFSGGGSHMVCAFK